MRLSTKRVLVIGVLPADAGVDDGLDLDVGAVAEVGQRPAGHRHHLLVRVEQRSGQRREARADLRKQECNSAIKGPN